MPSSFEFLIKFFKFDFFFLYKYIPNISWDILILKKLSIVHLKFKFN